MKLAISLFFGLVTLSNAETQNKTVRIYDCANVPKATLNHALAVAGRVLESTGFEAVWQLGSSGELEALITDYSAPDSVHSLSLDARHYLVVTVTIGPPDSVRPGLTGYALPQAREGAHAIVFYDRIQKLCIGSPMGPDVGTLLGAAIAHELGHVLMRSDHHSPAGLMKARWGQKEFLLLSCNRLGFTRENKQLIGQLLSPQSGPSN